MAADDPFSRHLEAIETVLGYTCRARRLSRDDADEFMSWARVRLLENDRAILRKFAGRSSLRSYLATVVQHLFLDWRNVTWGRWRPTAEARRRGVVAIELERLVLRDELPYEQAAHSLVTRGLATIEECHALWALLPRQPRPRRVDEEHHDTPTDNPNSAEDYETATEAARTVRALERVLATLPPADRILLQLKYWDGHTVARIAQLTGEDQKALYRRLTRLTVELRAALDREGITPETFAQVVGHLDDPDDHDESASPWPSPLVRPGDEHV